LVSFKWYYIISGHETQFPTAKLVQMNFQFLTTRPARLFSFHCGFAENVAKRCQTSEYRMQNCNNSTTTMNNILHQTTYHILATIKILFRSRKTVVWIHLKKSAIQLKHFATLLIEHINSNWPLKDFMWCLTITSIIFTFVSLEIFWFFGNFSSYRNSSLISFPSMFLALTHMSLLSAMTFTFKSSAGWSSGKRDFLLRLLFDEVCFVAVRQNLLSWYMRSN
jgi:hypothetical protein